MAGITANQEQTRRWCAEYSYSFLLAHWRKNRQYEWFARQRVSKTTPLSSNHLFCQIMKTLIKLTRYPYEEPYHVQLLFEAANGMQHASIEYYTNAQDLPELGDALVQFPFTDTREHIYEIGSEDPATRCAYYIRLRFFVIRPTGACGIEVRFNNNRSEAPYRETANFTIQAEVAGINRLGRLLKDFGRLEHRVLEWDGITGHLLQPEEEGQASGSNGGQGR